jgi:hypothetical protein
MQVYPRVALAIIILTAAALAGCEEKPIATIETDNPAIKVNKLFTHDGCTVYRFIDSNYQYFVKCTAPAGQVITAQQTISRESCGKNCVRSVTIQTVDGESRTVDIPAQ